jgi:hypothetical protein
METFFVVDVTSSLTRDYGFAENLILNLGIQNELSEEEKIRPVAL